MYLMSLLECISWHSCLWSAICVLPANDTCESTCKEMSSDGFTSKMTLLRSVCRECFRTVVMVTGWKNTSFRSPISEWSKGEKKEKKGNEGGDGEEVEKQRWFQKTKWDAAVGCMYFTASHVSHRWRWHPQLHFRSVWWRRTISKCMDRIPVSEDSVGSVELNQMTGGCWFTSAVD